MKIPLPFPKCDKCGRSWKQCVHTDCQGLLEINPSNYEVYCLKCHSHWNLWDSTYQCSCGVSFQAVEVKNAIMTMLEISALAIEEFEKREYAIKTRNDIATSSFKAFLNSFMGKLGQLAGLVVETVIRIFTQT